ncbi:MAG TPA: hypothetical protein VFO11_08670 [Candidatus Polarisedimenticolaceae bacterium]|nr:hypothetical protein [Candidatus Polarisedimenticolaceae bacterium]
MRGTVAFLALALVVFVVGETRYSEVDLWWHLALGEAIWTSHALPRLDTFSHTFAGKPQYVGEWLADLVLFLAMRAGGFRALNALKVALVLASLGCVWLNVRERLRERAAPVSTILVTLLLALFAVRFRLFLRPYLFTMLLCALFLYVLERQRRRAKDRWVLALPLLMLVWVQLSVGAVFGVGIVALAAASQLLERRGFSLSLVLAATAAASLAGPEGTRLYTLALDLAADPFRSLVLEYQPIRPGLLWGAGWVEWIPFQLLVLGAGAHLALRRGWRDPFAVGLLGFFLFQALRQVRLIEVFAIVAAPYAAETAAWIAERAGRRRVAAALVACVLVAVYLVAPGYAFGAGVQAGVFPEEAVRFLEANRVRGTLLNSYGFGGYLIWRAPDRPVFIDSRYRRLYSAEFLGDYLAMATSTASWDRVQARYGVDYAVFPYRPDRPDFPLPIAEDPAWAIVHWDDVAVVAVKRSPGREEMIRRTEYLVAKPTGSDTTHLLRQLRAHAQAGTLDRLLARADEEIARNPKNQSATLAKVYLLFQLGRGNYPEIRRLLEGILDVEPDFAMKRAVYAQILLELGDVEGARVALRKAAALDPQNLDVGGVRDAFRERGLPE